MALSRPILLVVLGTLLAVATVFTFQNARDAGDEPATGPAAQEAPAAQAPQPAQMSARDALQAALEAPAVRSGTFGLELSLRQGRKTEAIDVSGAFQGRGAGEIPLFDVDIRVSGGRRLAVGAVSTGDEAWLTQGATGYPVPEDVWSLVAEAGSASPQSAAAPSDPLSALGLNPRRWIKDLKDEGEETVGGVETRHVSATIDTSVALRDLGRSARRLGLTLPRPGEARRAALDIHVGTEDRIPRKLSLVVRGREGTMTLGAELGEVNQPQQIEAPARVSRSAPTGELALLARGFTQGLSLSTGINPASLRFPTNNNPRRMVRAVRDNRKVVLFLHQGALDDKATAESVRVVERRTRALVLRDRVEDTDRYGRLIEDLGVNQAPAVVIVDRRGNARLIEGYIDAGALRQEVADAR